MTTTTMFTNQNQSQPGAMNEPGYAKLAHALQAAYNQAAFGKGKERHASDSVAFEDQPMSVINRQLGSIDGFLYQAHKKSLEAKRLPLERAQAELLGAINYLAGAWIELERQRLSASKTAFHHIA